MNIIVSPNKDQVQEIFQWLYDEYTEDGEGFYCNREIIQKSFEKGELAIGVVNGESIGFIVYTYRDVYVELDIMSIKKTEQRKGYGKALYQKFKEIVEKRKIAIKGFCSPAHSESFWKSMGFIPLPNTGYSQPSLPYYKSLVNQFSPKHSNIIPEFGFGIKLWDCEPHKSEYIDCRWLWEFKPEHRFKVQPILIPADPNWTIEFLKGGESLKKDKIKYISKEINKYYKSPFLYIFENPIN